MMRNLRTRPVLGIVPLAGLIFFVLIGGLSVFADENVKESSSAKSLSESVDYAKLPQERQPLPAGVKWDDKGGFAAQTPTRRVSVLNGYWRFQPVKGLAAPEKPAEWGYALLPFPTRGTKPILDESFKAIQGKWKNDDLASYDTFWFERDVFVPAEYKGNAFLLTYNDFLMQYPKPGGVGISLFVNGSFACEVSADGPGYIDLTRWVKPGGPNRIAFAAGKDYEFLHWNLALEAYNLRAVSAHFPYVICDFRNKRVTVRFELTNHSTGPQTVAYRARFSEWKGAEEAHSVDGDPVTIGPGETRTVSVSGAWKNPKEWTPETPELYNVVLEGRQGDALVDVTPPVRFGFREVWTDKGAVYINGKRCSIRGKSHNYLSTYGFDKNQIALLRATGQNADRTHKPTYPKGFETLKSLDVADEEGWLVTFEISGSRQVFLDKPEDTRKNFMNILKVIGNHPSVFAWQRSGNGYVFGPHGHPMHIGGVVQKDVQEKEWAYKVRRMVNEIDPTRLYFYYRHGTGGNIRGIMTSMSYGIPLQDINEWISYWAGTRQDPFMPTEQQIFSRPAFFWQRGSRESVLMEHHARFFGEKAYEMITEEKVNRWQDLGKDKLGSIDYWTDIYSLAFKSTIRSWRTYGISGYLFHVGFLDRLLYTDGKLNKFGKTIKEVNSPVLFYLGGPAADFVNKDHNYFAGEEIGKSAIIVNDTFHDISGRISMVNKRSLRFSIVRVAMMAGTLHPNPIIIGIKDFPCSPIRCISLSIMKYTLAI